MSLRLLVDADLQAKELVSRLRRAGHDVMTANEAGLRTGDDPAIFEYARKDHRVVLTKNAKDFRALHENEPDHPGILAVYESDNKLKDMTRPEIARATDNIAATEIDLTGLFMPLNHWNY